MELEGLGELAHTHTAETSEQVARNTNFGESQPVQKNPRSSTRIEHYVKFIKWDEPVQKNPHSSTRIGLTAKMVDKAKVGQSVCKQEG